MAVTMDDLLKRELYLEEVREAAARGIKLLDEYGPKNWTEQLHPGDLNLGSCAQCILGQVYGDFGRGTWALGAALGLASDADFHAPAYGFDIPGYPDDYGDDEATVQVELTIALRNAIDMAYPNSPGGDNSSDFWVDLKEAWLQELRAAGRLP